jgi:putative membrane-bound dehydrogenase-like protein
MPLRPILFFLACFPAIAEDTSLVRSSDPLSPEEERRAFQLPEGFSASLVASEPIINKPMNLAFDAKGRLWCTSSAEYPWAVPKEKWKSPDGHLDSSRDKIIVFSDSNGDGIPDQPTVFADNLNIPIGVLPYRNGCIAWSIPNIWFLADTDGDGRCDQRTILFGPLGWEMDTHGMISSLIMGPDGWIYATHGFNNTSHFEVRPENNPAAAGRPEKPSPSAQNTGTARSELDWGFSLDLHSGNVFRFKPDGSAVEPYSWGQVNPFGMCQDSSGAFYTADCHSNPISQLIPGSFLQSFGKPHDGLGFAPVMCEHAHGSTGLCGVVYLDGNIWGPSWNDHMLVGNCVTSRINHDTITFAGATPKATEQPDFLVSADPWFRPVNLQLGPDGALYVADFYNRIIGHYEVPLTHPGRDRERGRIWRIAREKSQPSRSPQPEAASLAAIRFGLSDKGWDGGAESPPARLSEAFLHRSILQPSAAGIAPALNLVSRENDPSLRQAAMVALRAGLLQQGGFEELARLKPDPLTPHLARVIRSIQSPEASAWTLNHLVSHTPADPAELRSTINALARNLPAESEAKLVTFIQSQYQKDEATQLTLAAAIRDGIARRGTTPGAATAAWLTEVANRLFKSLATTPPATTWDPAPGDGWTLQSRPATDGAEITILSSLGKQGENFAGTTRSNPFPCPASLSFWLSGHRGKPDQPPHERTFARLLDATTGEEIQRAYPPRNDTAHFIEWNLASHAGKSVAFEIADQDNNDSGNAYAWIGAGRFHPPVISIPSTEGETPLRSAAQMAAELRLSQHLPALARFLARPSLSPETRSTIASALAALNQPDAIAAVLRTAPGSTQQTLAEILAGTPEGAAALMACGIPRLLTAPVVISKINALNRPDLTGKREDLTRDLPPASAETDALIQARIQQHANARRDPTAGLAAFRTHCASCHRIGNEGKVVGPQLDGAGNRGLDRLCEDILDPHRAVDPNFRMHIITMKDGTVHAGLVRRSDNASLTLVNAAGEEATLARSAIATDSTSNLSLMPATFAQSIPEADFHNLVAWLASLTAPPAEK